MSDQPLKNTIQFLSQDLCVRKEVCKIQIQADPELFEESGIFW